MKRASVVPRESPTRSKGVRYLLSSERDDDGFVVEGIIDVRQGSIDATD